MTDIWHKQEIKIQNNLQKMSSIREEDFYKAVDTILVEFEGAENLNEQQRDSFYNLIQRRDVFSVLLSLQLSVWQT